MSVNLKKGQKIDLKKDNGKSLKHLTVGLGWDAIAPGFFKSLFSSTPKFDCDASAIMCQNGKLLGTQDLVYFGNRQHPSGAVVHTGDNLTGDGDGDDEQIIVNLEQIPSQYDKIIFVVNIYQAVQRSQHFGMIRNAFIRIVDNDTHEEICRYDLSEKFNNMIALIFAEVYRKDGVWKFNAIGQATDDVSLTKVAARYQV